MELKTLRCLALTLLPYSNVLASHHHRARQNDDPARYGGKANPPYMVDNTHNTFHVAPDKGTQNGPIWPCSGSLDSYLASIESGKPSYCDLVTSTNATVNSTQLLPLLVGNSTNSTVSSRADRVHERAQTQLLITNQTVLYKNLTVEPNINAATTSYWLPSLAPLGAQPLAPSGYKFYRDVVKDYKADNTGSTDASEAINAAISDGNRCGEKCSSTFTLGAIVFFPPGTYKICSPIIQLYYTQFIGDAINPPTIKGCSTFKGIALIDTDPYIPGGNGNQWFVNQNQFFRQIRNFVFDLSDMPLSTADNDQPLVPTGIHWQAAQATSLQNLVFNMPVGTKGTHVGIFMENGSGGFVSDLTFNGGAIGWRAGSQQYTARGLVFKDCQQAVQMVWSWGFNWEQITISGGAIAFNISGKGGITGQGTGSVSVIDSSISNVPIGILTRTDADAPSIVLENVKFASVPTAVQVSGGSALLAGGSKTIALWATGQRFNGGTGGPQTGDVSGAPSIAPGLLDQNKQIFTRSRPQYEDLGTGSFLVATRDAGVKNDGTGDQSAAINAFLLKAANAGQIAYFPAGIYQIGRTVFVPTGSRIQGSSWSQIQGGGFFFQDLHNPQVMVRVGNQGDVGSVEIVEMLFTVRGPTAGAIMMEWNVAASKQGSAGMWDTHFRVGGGIGTDLDAATCPKFGFNQQCIAASLMLHVTPQSNGYFENVWTWVADHDNDLNMDDLPDPTSNQISVYVARGMLIESQGPSWFYGTGSEHTVLYQYQLQGAKSVYMGHIQTETPYYQPVPLAPAPFGAALSFPGDPSFSSCQGDTCQFAWGARIIESQNVVIHSAGLYSFFNEYYQDCIDTFTCQDNILEVRGSTGVVIFNLFTIGVTDIATGIDNTKLLQAKLQSGYTTEVSVWIPKPGSDTVDIVYVGTPVWSTPTARCPPPCILVLPPSPISSATTISPDPYTTSFEYGHGGSTVIGGQTVTTFLTTTTTVTINIPPITIPKGSGLPYSNINITSGSTSGPLTVQPSVTIPPIGIGLPDGSGGTTTRTVSLPPWPEITEWPLGVTGGGIQPTQPGQTVTIYTGITTTISVTGPTVTTLKFPQTTSVSEVDCPPFTEITFATPSTTFTTSCPTPTQIPIVFNCETTKVFTFFGPTVAAFTQDCTLVQVIPTPPPSVITTTAQTTTTTPLPVFTTWPPGVITPVTTPVPSQSPVPGGVVIPCKVWWFNFCTLSGVKIYGWEFDLPEGIYPVGPPPWIKPPPQFTFKGTLPPWPKITIRPGEIDYPDEDPKCETESASVCATSVIQSVTVAAGTTKTTGSSTSTYCETVYGCSISGQATTATSTNVAACTPTPTAASDSDDGCAANAAIYPTDGKNLGQIPNILAQYAGKYDTISDPTGAVVQILVPSLDRSTLLQLQKSADVAFAYYPDAYYLANQPSDDGTTSTDSATALDDETAPDQDSSLKKRAPVVNSNSKEWARSQLSTLPKTQWKNRLSGSWDGQNYLYRYNDNPEGAGQFVYLMGERVVWTGHPEFSAAKLAGRIEQFDIRFYDPTDRTNSHGSGVAAKVMGAKLGVASQITIVELGFPKNRDGTKRTTRGYAESITQAALILNDIDSKKRDGKAVVNMSFTLNRAMPAQEVRTLYNLLRQLDAHNVVLVAAAGNKGEFINTYPQLFADPGPANQYSLPNLITVGASTINGVRWYSSNFAGYLATYAPGAEIYVPRFDDGGLKFTKGSGTSYAAPQVAGLIAYWRALPSTYAADLQLPSNAKKLLLKLHRPFATFNNPIIEDSVRVIWNGHVKDKSCLLDRPTTWDTKSYCPPLNDHLADVIGTQDATDCTYQPNGSAKKRQAAAGVAGAACGWPNAGDDKTLTYTSSSVPSPSCTAGGCGTLCVGYYCNPSPSSPPPDHQDPKDPNSSGSRSTTTINGGGVGGTGAAPQPTTTPTAPPPTTTTPPGNVPPSTTAPSPPPPKPTPTTQRIAIVLEEVQNPGFPATDRWRVYDSDLSQSWDICNAHTAFSQSTTDGLNMVTFPPALGPFTTQLGYTCTYQGTSGALGSMACTGVAAVTCSGLSQLTPCGVSGSPDERLTVVCTF